MNLTTKDIQAIDSYLEHSEVEYADIRMEMVDHVASEVEAIMEKNQASFYDSFKIYMAAHKKQLLKTNKKFKWAAEKKVWVALGKQLIKPQVFLFGPVIYLILGELQTSLVLMPFLSYLPAILLFACGIFYAIFQRTKKLRFSGVERTGAVFCLLSQIVLFLFSPLAGGYDFSTNMKYSFVLNAVVIVIIIAFIRVFQDFRKEYSKFSTMNFA